MHSSWSAQIGTDEWAEGEGNYQVYQVRDKAIIWSGRVAMWHMPNAPGHGTGNREIGHARRQEGSAAGQWQAVDLMFSTEEAALAAVAR
jgi:hypothetical protein